MMKKFAVLPLAALAFAACSDTDQNPLAAPSGPLFHDGTGFKLTSPSVKPRPDGIRYFRVDAATRPVTISWNASVPPLGEDPTHDKAGEYRFALRKRVGTNWVTVVSPVNLVGTKTSHQVNLPDDGVYVVTIRGLAEKSNSHNSRRSATCFILGQNQGSCPEASEVLPKDDNEGHTDPINTVDPEEDDTPSSSTSYALTVGKTGAGSGTVTSGETPEPGINCGADCSESLPSGTVVTLTAAAGANSTFDGWIVGGSPVAANQNGTLTVTVNAPMTVSAKFKANQTITNFALADKTFGDDPFTISATGGNSGNAVTFALASTSKGCELDGTTVTVTGATAEGESCTIVASQAGDDDYNAAPTVTRSFSIAKANQTISFTAPSNVLFSEGATVTLNATATSGLTVSFASQTSSVCTVSGTRVSFVSAGTCTIQATQAGNDNYNAAAPVVTRSFGITAWRLGGFHAPVNMTPGALNVVKAGSTVPLKFNVFMGTAERTDVAAVKRFSAQKIACSAASETADLVSNTGSTSLRYSGTPGVDGQFIQNWQTPKTAGVCYKAFIETQDGSIIEALFQLK